MVTMRDIQLRREDILAIAARHGAHHVRVFGSIVRGSADDASDLDLLVEMDDDRSLIDHVALINELEAYLGRKVDVVSQQALHRSIRDEVLRQAVVL